MKKKKLTLSRETLAHLEARGLRGAHGANSVDTCNQCTDWETCVGSCQSCDTCPPWCVISETLCISFCKTVCEGC
ncbi:MAG TPA: hypothetical protein VGS22_04155 [Thermoanaerobaculia bacterium]|jgi:hypothetical protein|nr:hypothetical protein [Thermoanaerobaculia bacterium]